MTGKTKLTLKQLLCTEGELPSASWEKGNSVLDFRFDAL